MPAPFSAFHFRPRIKAGVSVEVRASTLCVEAGLRFPSVLEELEKTGAVVRVSSGGVTLPEGLTNSAREIVRAAADLTMGRLTFRVREDVYNVYNGEGLDGYPLSCMTSHVDEEGGFHPADSRVHWYEDVGVHVLTLQKGENIVLARALLWPTGDANQWAIDRIYSTVWWGMKAMLHHTWSQGWAKAQYFGSHKYVYFKTGGHSTPYLDTAERDDYGRYVSVPVCTDWSDMYPSDQAEEAAWDEEPVRVHKREHARVRRPRERDWR